MAHHQLRAHESASAMSRPGGSTALRSALAVVSAPAAGTILAARPALGVAAVDGLLPGPILGLGHRLGRLVTASVPGTRTRATQAAETARLAAHEE